MQWLSRGDNRTERGAVAVVVALFMVPLLGFAAISIDVASMWSDRQRLQTSADSAALAIAQACAHDTSTCVGTAPYTANTLTTANFGSGASALPPDINMTSGTVTVKTLTANHHVFAPVLGWGDSTNVRASATAGWGAPIAGPSMLPMTISICQYEDAIKNGLPTVEMAIRLLKQAVSDTPCPGGWTVPGSFGWVKVDACASDSQIGDDLSTDPGDGMSSTCDESQFKNQLGKTVLLPIFDSVTTDGKFHVYGYAAFVFTGYVFHGKSGNPAGGNTSPCDASKVNSDNRSCIVGKFVQFVSLDDAFDYKRACTQDEVPAVDRCAPNLGDMNVSLTG